MCVQALLDAGADLAGKTHLDELAYSLNGENIHYGTPVNPACPDRIPGGSSSGSAVSQRFLISAPPPTTIHCGVVPLLNTVHIVQNCCRRHISVVHVFGEMYVYSKCSSKVFGDTVINGGSCHVHRQ